MPISLPFAAVALGDGGGGGAATSAEAVDDDGPKGKALRTSLTSMGQKQKEMQHNLK